MQIDIRRVRRAVVIKSYLCDLCSFASLRKKGCDQRLKGHRDSANLHDTESGNALRAGPLNRSVLRDAMKQVRHQRRPAGLVAGADAAAGVAVEVFVEQHQVAPVRIVGVAAVVAVAGPAARLRPAERAASVAPTVRAATSFRFMHAVPSRSGIRLAATRRRNGDTAPALRSSR